MSAARPFLFLIPLAAIVLGGAVGRADDTPGPEASQPAEPGGALRGPEPEPMLDGGAASATAPPVVAPGRRVVVRLVDPQGRVTAAPGVRVREERLRRSTGMDGTVELAAARAGVTGDDGLVVFPVDGELGPGESLRHVATWEGHDWDAREGEAAILLHHTTPRTDALRLGMQAFIELRDNNFMLQQQYVLINGSNLAIDLTGGAGLRIPLLVHEVFGEPLDLGYLPLRPDSRTSRFEVTPPRGRVAVERGALVYRGIVPPGRAVQVRASYAVPYDGDSRHTLSLRSPVDLDEVRVAVVSPTVSGLRASLGAPHRTLSRPTADGVELWLMPTAMPKAGEPLEVVLVNTPDRLAVTRRLGLALGGGVLFAVSALFFATRRRRIAAQ